MGAETADSVIIAIEARMDTSGVAQGTNAVTSSMSAVERSATQAESAVRSSATKIVESHQRMGASGMILQHVVRATSDQFAAGAPLATIFAQHLSMIAEAAALSGENMGAFGRVMSGPFGLALSASVSILTVLIGKHLEAGESAHSHETAEQTLTRALNGQADAVAKVTDALRAMREESENALRTDNQRIISAHNLAQRTLEVAIATRQRLKAELEQALADEEANQRRANDPTLAGEGGFNPGAAAQYSGRAGALSAQIDEQGRAIVEAERVLGDTTNQLARALDTAVGRVNEQFDERRRALERQAAIDTAAANSDAARARVAQNLQRAEAALNSERERSVRAAQALDDRNSGVTHRERVERDLVRPTAGGVLSQFGADRSGVPLNGHLVAGRRHEGVDLRGALGDPVVAPEGGIARVLNAPGGLGLYVEIRADSGARDLLGHLSAANIQSGDRVAAGQLVGLIGNSGNARGGPTHLHWQRQVNGQWVDPMRTVGSSGAAQEAEQAVRQAAELATRRLRDEDHFREELAGLNTDILNARRRQVETEQEAAADDIAAIRAEQTQRDQRIRDEATERSHRDPAQTVAANIEAGILLNRSAELAQTKIDVRNSLMQQRLDEQRIEIAQRDLGDQESVLQARAQLARTAMERRDIELRLLALQHQEELLAIQKQRAQQNLSPAQRAQLDRQEAASNVRYGLAQQNTIRQTAGPLQAFFAEVPRSAAEMNEALQHVAVDGLQALNDGLGQAASRFLHLGGIAGQVLGRILDDIIQIVLRQAEMAAFGGQQGGQGGFAGFIANLAAAFHPGGGGGTYGDAITADMNFATGGFMDISGNPGIDTNSLSINGKHVARVSTGETLAIIPQGKALGYRGGGATMRGGGITLAQTINVDTRGSVNPDGYAEHIRQTVRQETLQIVASASERTLHAVPSRMAQYDTDGR